MPKIQQLYHMQFFPTDEVFHGAVFLFRFHMPLQFLISTWTSKKIIACLNGPIKKDHFFLHINIYYLNHFRNIIIIVPCTGTATPHTLTPGGRLYRCFFSLYFWAWLVALQPNMPSSITKRKINYKRLRGFPPIPQYPDSLILLLFNSLSPK